jgi:hypothetical protein
MWKVYADDKWFDLRGHQQEAIDEYRKSRYIEVPHRTRGEFKVNVQAGPLHRNMEYNYTNTAGQKTILKYNPSHTLTSPHPPKERKWYTKVNCKWMPSYKDQIEAVEKYRDSDISLPREIGRGRFEVKFETVDTPGRATRYTYTTEDGRNVVHMKYAEVKPESPSVTASPTRKLTRSRSQSSSSPSSSGTRGKRANRTHGSAQAAASPHTFEKQAAYDLYGRYHQGYAPPDWALQEYDPNHEFMKEVEVYTTSHDTAAVMQCVTDREPVNIAMGKYYHNPQKSGYTAYYDQHKKLGPKLGSIRALCHII